MKTKTKPKQASSLGSKRIWELDFLKGTALLFMIFDHVVYDLGAFFSRNTSSLGFFKEGIGQIAAVIFMTVSAVSVTLGKRNLRHSLIVGSAAVFLTAFTFAFDKVTGSSTIIWFGILHFLALSMLIGHFAKKLPKALLLILSVCSFALGKYFLSLSVSMPYLCFLGLCSPDFYSSDFFPLFPNLAYTFLGLFIGKSIYKEKTSVFARHPKTKAINFLGRHTLIIYLVHQPVVLGVLYAIDFVLKKFG